MTNNKNDSQTATPDNPTEDLNDLLIGAPDNYILRQIFEPETEQETQNQHPNTSYPQETQTDHPNTQSTSTTQIDVEVTSELTKTPWKSPGNHITWKSTPP